MNRRGWTILSLHLVLWLAVSASPAPEAFAEKELELAGQIFALAPSREAYVTENFVVYYKPKETPKTYAEQVAVAFETAWAYYRDHGFSHPSFADSQRLVIELQPSFPDPDLLGQFVTMRLRLPLTSQYISAPYRTPFIQLRNDLTRDGLAGVCAHELFHCIQRAYDETSQAGTWLQESTATWAMDEVFPDLPADSCYVHYLETWLIHWGNGSSLTTCKSNEAAFKTFPYGAAVFFKFLTEHHPKGNQLIRDLWDYLSRTETSDPVKTIRACLGDLGGETEVFERYFTDFCVALQVRTEAPYQFRRGREIPFHLPPKVFSSDWNYVEFDPVSDRFKPAQFSEIAPLSAVYLQFLPPAELTGTAPFYLTLKTGSPSGLRFKILKWRGKRMEAQDAEFFDGRCSETIEGYGQKEGAVDSIAVVAVNPMQNSPQRFEIAASVGGPPYLKEVQLFQGASEQPAYSARWEETPSKRVLHVLRNQLELPEEPGPIPQIEVVVTFSRGIERSSKIQLGKTPLKWVGKPSADKTVWVARADRVEIDPATLQQGFLELQVSAEAPRELFLDANPATIPILSADIWKWKNYEASKEGPEANHGGVDTFHRISLHKKEVAYLQRILFKAGGKVYYDSEWLYTPPALYRTLKTYVDTPLDPKSARTGTVELTFSQPLGKVEFRVGELEVALTPDEKGTLFLGSFPLTQLPEREEVPFSVQGWDKDGRVTDANPKTVAQLPDKSYEKGSDQTHSIQLIKKGPPPTFGEGKFYLDSVLKRSDIEQIFPAANSLGIQAEGPEGPVMRYLNKDGTVTALPIKTDSQKRPLPAGPPSTLGSLETADLVSMDGPGGSQFALWGMSVSDTAPAAETSVIFQVFPLTISKQLLGGIPKDAVENPADGTPFDKVYILHSTQGGSSNHTLYALQNKPSYISLVTVGVTLYPTANSADSSRPSINPEDMARRFSERVAKNIERIAFTQKLEKEP